MVIAVVIPTAAHLSAGVHNPKSVQLSTWGSARQNSNITSFVALVLLLPGSKHRGRGSECRVLSSVPQRHNVMLEFRRAAGLQATAASPQFHTAGLQATAASPQFHTAGLQATAASPQFHTAGLQATVASPQFHTAGLQATAASPQFHTRGVMDSCFQPSGAKMWGEFLPFPWLRLNSTPFQ